MNLNELPFGTIDAFNVVVEISEGSRNKYEMNEETGFLELDFVFSESFAWMYNYGFISGTRGGDGDRLDAMVVAHEPLLPGTVVKCRAIGMIEELDRGEVDNKLIVVPVADKAFEDVQTFEDLGEDVPQKLEEFYQRIAREKNKIIEIKGFHGKQRADEEVTKSLQ